MRLRFGFVSNSSSASFVLHVALDKKKLLEFFRQHGWCSSFFDLDVVIPEMEKCLVRAKEYGDNTYALELQADLDVLKKVYNDGDYLRSELASEIIELLFRFQDLCVEEDGWFTTISGHTTMWNSAEDMRECMLYIIAELAANQITTRLEVEHDA